MTVTKLAASLGVDRSTIYRKLKESNININDFKADNGEITAEGVSLIGSLFDGNIGIKTEEEEKPENDTIEAAEQTSKSAELLVALAKIEMLEATIAMQESIIADLKKDKENMQSQIVWMQQIKVLTDGLTAAKAENEPEEDHKRKGIGSFFRGLRGKR